jgi:hypothetical protein
MEAARELIGRSASQPAREGGQTCIFERGNKAVIFRSITLAMNDDRASRAPQIHTGVVTALEGDGRDVLYRPRPAIEELHEPYASPELTLYDKAPICQST